MIFSSFFNCLNEIIFQFSYNLKYFSINNKLFKKKSTQKHNIWSYSQNYDF